jgi:phage shock protein A
MGIMTRILRLWKADIHGVMDQFEDKELLLKQHLREMDNNLHNREGHLKHISETLHRTRNDLTTRQLEIEKLEKDLTLALTKEKDDIAKLLIRKVRVQQKHCEHMQQQYESMEKEQEQLSQLIEEQKLQYETLKIKAAAFCRQAEQTKFYDANAVSNTTGDTCTIDEEEIELELMRRKENLQKEGGTT